MRVLFALFAIAGIICLALAATKIRDVLGGDIGFLGLAFALLAFTIERLLERMKPEKGA